VLEARGSDFAFLALLAFAAIPLTNVILLLGTFRARKLPPLAEVPPEQECCRIFQLI
jgi:hypothetical protein